MSRGVMCISAIVAVVLCLFSGSAVAQNQATQCLEATSINFNAAQLAGKWYEVARNPAPNPYSACIELNISNPDATTLTINNTFTTMPSMLWMNQTLTANLTLTGQSSTTGFNVTFVPTNSTNTSQKSSPPAVFKLLATDYTSYAFICGYTSATDNSTSFGIVLTRQRFLNSSALLPIESNASSNFPYNFLNGTMPMITQNNQCYTNAAMTAVPMLSAIFAAIYALLKFVN